MLYLSEINNVENVILIFGVTEELSSINKLILSFLNVSCTQQFNKEFREKSLLLYVIALLSSRCTSYSYILFTKILYNFKIFSLTIVFRNSEY